MDSFSSYANNCANYIARTLGHIWYSWGRSSVPMCVIFAVKYDSLCIPSYDGLSKVLAFKTRTFLQSSRNPSINHHMVLIDFFQCINVQESNIDVNGTRAGL